MKSQTARTARRIVGILGTIILLNSAAAADRIVLAPRGLVSPPFSARIEYAVHPYIPRADIGWLNIGLPQEDLGLELELERFEVNNEARETFSFQYTFTGNGVADFAPAISLGIRDLLRRGRELQGIFAAATKNIGVPLATERTIQNLKVHIGFGTSAMDGLFAGAEAKVLGVWVGGEYLSRRFNAALAVPVFSNLALRAYTLDGSSYFGASFSVRR